MAVEAAVGAHGKFQIDERAFVDPREGRSFPGFLREIGRERVIAKVDSGQADAADRHAVALFEFRLKLGARNSQPAFFALLLDSGDLADLFDNSSEHKQTSRVSSFLYNSETNNWQLAT
jgi:hypothetical protein